MWKKWSWSNAFFAKLGLSNRVDETSTVLQEHIWHTRIRGLINEAANENELRKEAHLKIIKNDMKLSGKRNTGKPYITFNDVAGVGIT